MSELFSKLHTTLSKALLVPINHDRKKVLEILIHYIKNKQASMQKPLLNFICTHNSRRSQFSQIWAQTAAAYYGVDVVCFSGGVEVTAFNERAVASLERSGFIIEQEGEINPKYKVFYDKNSKPIVAFSKLFDHNVNPSKPVPMRMRTVHLSHLQKLVLQFDTRTQRPLMTPLRKRYDMMRDHFRLLLKCCMYLEVSMNSHLFFYILTSH
jgi:arsenate reductase